MLWINEHQEIGILENENITTLVNTCVIVSHVHSGTVMTCTIASGLTSTSTIQFQLAPKQILISRAVIIPAVYQSKSWEQRFSLEMALIHWATAIQLGIARIPHLSFLSSFTLLKSSRLHQAKDENSTFLWMTWSMGPLPLNTWSHWPYVQIYHELKKLGFLLMQRRGLTFHLS